MVYVTNVWLKMKKKKKKGAKIEAACRLKRKATKKTIFSSREIRLCRE